MSAAVATVAAASSLTVRPARRTQPSLAAAAKPWKDVPFPILFVLGTLFGVVFAMTVVSMTKPKPVAPTFSAITPAAQMVAAAPRIESAPFVAWAAPPAMPTVAAEPQLPTSTPAAAPAAAPAHGHHAKHGRGSRRASR